LRSHGFKSYPLSKPQSQTDNFANGTSAVYIDMMYDQWKEDPNSVHSSWKAYFKNIDQEVAEPYQAPPSIGKTQGSSVDIQAIIEEIKKSGMMEGATVEETGQGIDYQKAQHDAFKVMALIRSFMAHGHLKSDLDPLKLDTVFAEIDLGAKYAHPSSLLKGLLDYKFYDFEESDLDRKFFVDVPELCGIFSKKKDWTLRELIKDLEEAYTKNIGVEYMHIIDRDQCNWIRDKFELR
jgi:2-oxoglutarate dehydrogenase E1 component